MGLILPSITLSFPVICSTVRVFRASLLEEMHRDYVSFARANGMTVNKILWKKVFRNALPPVITLFCQYVSYLFAGSAAVEKVLSIKGVGNYLMNCIMAVSYTHLDVYKRQILPSIPRLLPCTFRFAAGGRPSPFVFPRLSLIHIFIC